MNGAAQRRGAVLSTGAVGSLLLAVGGLGAGALTPGSRVEPLVGVGLPLCVLGGVLLAAAWWMLREAAGRTVLTAAGLWSLPLLAGPPLMSRDLYAYVGQGALVAAGLDPYSGGPGQLPGPLSAGVDAVWAGTPAPYGPVWLGLCGLLVRVTGQHLLTALLLTRLLSVAGVALLAWALPRLARAHGVPVGQALWLGVANPLVLLHLVAGGHNDALMIGLLAAGLALLVPGRDGRSAVATADHGCPRLVAATVLVSLAALVKVPAALALAFLPLLATTRRPAPGSASPEPPARRPWPSSTLPGLARAGTLVVVVAAVTTAGTTALSGLGYGWLTSLDAGRARLSLFSPLTGLGVALPGGAETLDAVLAGGLLAAALVCVLAWLLTGRHGALPMLGTALLAVSLLLPVVQPWYVLWGVVLLAAVLDARRAAALGAACLVLALLVAPSGRSVVRSPLYGLPVALAAVATVLVSRAGLGARTSKYGEILT